MFLLQLAKIIQKRLSALTRIKRKQPLKAVFIGTLLHALDAAVEVGVSREELVDTAVFGGAGLFLELFEFGERKCHGARVLAV